jgi:hypothetical protein
MARQFPIVSGNTRWALLRIFPDAVYFRETDNALMILAVLHLRRRPGLWRARS